MILWLIPHRVLLVILNLLTIDLLSVMLSPAFVTHSPPSQVGNNTQGVGKPSTQLTVRAHPGKLSHSGNAGHVVPLTTYSVHVLSLVPEGTKTQVVIVARHLVVTCLEKGHIMQGTHSSLVLSTNDRLRGI